MRIILLVTLLWIMPQAFAFNQHAFIEMHVEPLIDKSKSKATLKFSLKYTGDSILVVDSHNLPGMRVARSISYMADSINDYKSKPFKPCPTPKEKIFFDEGGIGDYELKPGEILIQYIDLFQVYSEFEKILGVCDFVFYWNYQLDIENGYKVPRLAGAVVIPSTLKVTELHPQKATVVRSK